MTYKFRKSKVTSFLIIGLALLLIMIIFTPSQDYILFTGASEHWKGEIRYFLKDTDYGTYTVKKNQIILWFNYKDDADNMPKQVNYKLIGSNLNITGVGVLTSQGVFEQGGLECLNCTLTKNNSETYLEVEWDGKKENFKLLEQ